LAATPWSPPRFEVRTLSNGVPVIVLPRRPTGTVDVRLVLRTGEALDPVGKEGLVATAFDLADEGAAGMDASTLSAKVRALGAELSSTSVGDGATITVRGLRESLEPALDLWVAPIREPAFADADLALVRARRIQRVQLQMREPAGAADRVQWAVQYGAGYRGRSPTEASLKAVDSATIRDFWGRYVGPANAAIVAGGDLTADELVPLLEARLGAWKGGEKVALAAEPQKFERETIYVVNVPGAPQSAIRAFEPAKAGTDPTAPAFDVALEALGGAFISRINRNLREERGWTYGARCGAADRAGPVFLQCGTLVRADVTGPALAELRRELREVQTTRPLTAEEATDLRTSLLRSYPSTRETVGAWLGEAAFLWLHDRPLDFPATYLKRLEGVKLADADRAVRDWLAPDELAWVVAGDLATIRAQLEPLGLPIVVREP
jgi:zinc protease